MYCTRITLRRLPKKCTLLGDGAGVILESYELQVAPTPLAAAHNQTGCVPDPLPPLAHRHGGNRQERAEALGCRPNQLLDLSASLVPFGPPGWLPRALGRALRQELVPYPDRRYAQLRQAIAAHHQLDPAQVLPGNGAAELFTWAARDAAAFTSLLPQPGFADYRRALACWNGPQQPLALRLHWGEAFPQPFEAALATPLEGGAGHALWVTNPHNPTGQLWSRCSLEPLLERFGLVLVDEAFLPLVPEGEQQSLVPLLEQHPNLVVIRSLTKLFAVAGLRLGYALGAAERLAHWATWRDPWPVNGLAAAVGGQLLADRHWARRVEHWVAQEGAWLPRQLGQLPGLRPLPSAANFLLLKGEQSLEPLRCRLEQRHHILLRDCRSFPGLGDHWLRLALADRGAHRRLIRALGLETAEGRPAAAAAPFGPLA